MSHARWLWSSLLFSMACSRTPSPGGAPTTSTSTASASAAPAAPASVAPSAAAPSASATISDAGTQDSVATESGEIRITPLHHATLLLDFAGKAVYVDPTKDASYQGRPKATAIFVTDVHGDHLDPATLDQLSTADTVIVAPPAVAEKLPKSVGKVRVMKNGEASSAKAPVVPALAALGVQAVPMYNIQRGPGPGKLYHDEGRGNGYLLSFGGKRLYLSGDTECTPEMKALENIDVAFVCMNLPYTMPPSEAAECIRAFSPKVVYPYHFRGSDPAEISRALGGTSIEVRVRKWY